MTGIRDLTVVAAQEQWRPETTYLNTASYGLPPTATWDELQAALAEWRGGATSWEKWMPSVDRARAAFAELVGVRLDDVTIGANVSSLFGPLAAALPAGTRVLAPEGDFTSLLFPFLAQAARGVEVSLVPLERLAEAVDASHRRDRVQRRAVGERRGRAARRAGRGRTPPRRADRRGRDPGRAAGTRSTRRASRPSRVMATSG